MQQKMDRSHQRITRIEETNKQDGIIPENDGQYTALYDEAWRSEESDAASLQEGPITDFHGDFETCGSENPVNSAIAEVSKDFLDGVRAVAKHNDSEESQLSSDTDFKLVRGSMAYGARYPETMTGLSDTDWNPYGTESDNNASPRLQGNSVQQLSWNPPLHSTDIHAVTPFSASSHAKLDSIHESHDRRETGVMPQTNITSDFSTISHVSETDRELGLGYESPEMNRTTRAETTTTQSTRINEENKGKPSSLKVIQWIVPPHESSYEQNASVLERAKSIGIPQNILECTRTDETSGWKFEDLTPDTTQSAGYISEEDHLGQIKERVLPTTKYIDRSQAGVDYGVLQRDLQEIQDSLQRTLGTGKVGYEKAVKRKSPASSDTDIIPSTTTTPERLRKNKMAWDFAADLGYVHAEGLMGEISLDTYTTSSHRPSYEKMSYNSDGDETHTSGCSSTKQDHRTAADQALANMAEILQPMAPEFHSNADVDHMLSNFRDQRRHLESRYEQLSNQGLAEKVCRILNNQDPNSQANGILSEVSAEEKEMKTRCALGLGWNYLNLSANSNNGIEESNGSLVLSDNVRRRLDMSGISSVDSSRIGDKSSFNFSTKVRGFTAFEDMANFLSSQMTKASERTFNHSIEMTVPPQHIQCYPLFDGKQSFVDGREEKKKEDEHELDEASQVTNRETVSDIGAILEKEKDQENYSLVNPTSDRESSNTSSPREFQSGMMFSHKEKYRPYRPAGSRDVYYTESDTTSVTDSVTTMESTHIGSDDAHGPSLPSTVLGSRGDVPNVPGIYSSRKQPQASTAGLRDLPTIQEKSSFGDERDVDSPKIKEGSHMRREGEGRENRMPDTPEGVSIQVRTKLSESPQPEFPADVAGRGSKSSENRMAEVGRGRENPETERAQTTQKACDEDESGEVARNSALNAGYKLDYHLSPDVQRNVDIGTRSRRDRQLYSLPSNAFVSSQDVVDGDNSDTEPLSLRIKMRYEEDEKGIEKRLHERGVYRERDNNSYGLFEERHLRGSYNQPQETNTAFNMLHSRQGSESPEYGVHRFSPTSEMLSYKRERERAVSPVSRAVRSSSPERPHYTDILNDRSSQMYRRNYPFQSEDNATNPFREARLSPAFHTALSPEMRSAIETRSPTLSRQLERSLAQPPARSVQDERPLRDQSRPTFLARERRDRSPTEYGGRRGPLPSRGRSAPNHKDTGRQSSFRYISDKPVVERKETSQQTQWKPLKDIDRQSNPRDDTVKQPPKQTIPKRYVELTLEGMSSDSEIDKEIDCEPVSNRVQLLTHALTQQEQEDSRGDKVNINDLWEQFKAANESRDSSMSSGRVEGVADLLRNPTQHLVRNYLKERQEYMLDRQERAEKDRHRQKQQQQQLLQVRHNTSEEEPSTVAVAGPTEGTTKQAGERQKKRNFKKKKGRNHAIDFTNTKERNELGTENVPDSLFSIAEDSFEQASPRKGAYSSPLKKSRSKGWHVIDPNMNKLRDRISQQRHKIDKGKLKELQRVECVRRLEELLTLKKQDGIGDGTFQREMEEISTTSSPSVLETTPLSNDSTTAKDSSTEMHRWKAEKERKIKESKSSEEKKLKHGIKFTTQADVVTWSDIKPSITGDLDLRLLRLVKEGLLTPNEAYTLAVGRVNEVQGHRSHSASDSVMEWRDERPHKRYNPYSRREDINQKTRHVLKSCLQQEDVSNNRKLPDSDNMSWTTGMRISRDRVNKSRKQVYMPQRETSFSPSRRQRAQGSSPAQRISQRRTRSSSPLSSLGSKRLGKHTSRIGGRKSRIDKIPPVRESLSWDIPMDLHPSLWREPVVGGQNQSKVLNKTGQRTKDQRFISRGRPMKHKDSWRTEEKAEHDGPYNPIQEFRSSQNYQPRDMEDNRGFSQDHTVETELNSQEPHSIFEDLEPGVPAGIPPGQWAHVLSQDVLTYKENHWDVDPQKDRVQYILNKPSTVVGHRDNDDTCPRDEADRPVRNMSLQEAFLAYKQEFISRCKQRQKRLVLSQDNRHMQECLRVEREAIFAEHQRLVPPNLYAHPYSDNLYQPKARVFSMEEMREMSKKKYRNLPEVLQKKENEVREQESKLNRLRARLFNKKVQREALKKNSMRRR